MQEWEQQPDEGASAFAAAQTYFAMGRQRSQRRVAEQCQHSLSIVQRWAKRHRWMERARAYDTYCGQQRAAKLRQQHEVAAQETARKWQERMADECEAEWQTAHALTSKANEMLARPLEEARWTWRDAVAMLREAARMAHEAAEAATEAAAVAAEQSGELTVRVEYVGETLDEEHTATGADT
ncbi:MAG: hypothetical protein HC876_19170 [Chloroflexaceae bacterium]|nr:hypothetical protein [Chloroflexaceae bacterium]